MRRRELLAGGMAMLGGAAYAQAPAGWPGRPVTIVNPFAAGGFTDAFGRAIAAHLQKLFGQPFVTEYRSGAGATLGATHVARAAPDGLTLLYAPTTPWVVAPNLYKTPGYDPLKDLAPIALVGATPMVLNARTGLPFTDVAGLVAAARAKPGTLSYASSGVGSLPHLMGSFFAALAGLQLNHVTYRGGAPAMNDLLAGHVDLMFEAVPNVAQHVAAGRAVPLMTSGDSRTPLLPSVPTVAEAGFPDLNLMSWIGIAAPAGTPAPILVALNGGVNEALATPELREMMARSGMVPLGGPPEAMAARMARELPLYRRIIEGAGITAE